jgi:hypothetical protein
MKEAREVSRLTSKDERKVRVAIVVARMMVVGRNMVR